jgi:hypothetical protein
MTGVGLAMLVVVILVTWLWRGSLFVGILGMAGLGLAVGGPIAALILMLRPQPSPRQQGSTESRPAETPVPRPRATYSLVYDKKTREVLGLWLADPKDASAERKGYVETLLMKHGAGELVVAPRRIVPNTFDAKGGCFVMFGNQRAPGE